MRKSLFVLPFLIMAINSMAQDEPSAAPKINAFSLSPDNLGAIANSVNLFTGDLALPLNLVSIPGRDGLGIDVSLSYSSANIENISDVWNLDAPTGILGLGWSMGQSQIVVDNKQTGARDDDEFYLVDGGGSTRLICVGNSSGIKSYKTKTFSNKIIKYTFASETWEITHEDGSKSFYGDQNSNRNTVQWIVKWGNWIGNSNVASGQQRQGIVWNLSEVRNVWGDKVTYTYTQTQNFVGQGNNYQTEASYLSRINDSWGREVELVYRNKLPEEYADPHTEQVEPDAYQERYERLYLDKIYVRADGNNFYEIGLKYVTNLLGTGNLTKRLLKAITKTNPAGVQLPGTSFDYLITGVMKGSLSAVATGTGGSVSFEYDATGLTINHSSKELNITAPSGYAEPRVFMEENYVVVTWRQLNGSAHDSNERPVRVFVYTWDGKWRESDLGTFGNTKLISNQQDFQVVTGKDFFAMLRPVSGLTTYWLYIWSKNEKVAAGWDLFTSNINLDTHDNTKEVLIAGNEFVAVSNNNGKIIRYVRNSTTWTSSTINDAVATRFTTGTNNYIVSLNTAPNPDVLTMYYLDETKTWQIKTLTTGFNSGSNSHLYSTNGIIMAMIDGTNEYIFRWDSDYNLNSNNTGFGYADNSFVRMINESMISVTTSELPPASNGKQRALRFNGVNWIDTGEKAIQYFIGSSYGEDLMIWSSNAYSTPVQHFRKEFSPNFNSWQSDISHTASGGSNYRIGHNVFSLDNQIYFRNTNGLWTPQTNPNGTGFIAGGANHFFGGLGIQFYKNGNFQQGYPITGRSHGVINYFDIYTYQPRQRLTNPYIMVTCLSSMANNFENVTNLTLNRFVNYGFEGKQNDYPITRITVNDGTTNRFVSYDYNSSKSTIDPSGSTALYNLVTTVPGSASATVVPKPFGHTDTYFYNGLTEAELVDTFPKDISYADVLSYFKLLTGQVYRTNIYSSAGGSPVAESSTIFDYDNSTGYNMTMPYKGIVKKDGLEISTEYAFDNITTKQLTLQRVVTKHATTQETQVVDTEYTYAWQKYPSCLAKNILSPVVQTKRDVNYNTYTESSISRWKDWPCTGPNCLSSTVPAPADQFAWKGTNSSDFTWWDVAQTPSADWLYAGKILSRDATGLELEQQGNAKQISGQIWDQNKRAVLASVSNAPLSKIAYAGFEDNVTGNWVWADGTINTGTSKTGLKYMSLGTTGLTKTGLDPAEKYVISLWAKSSGGSIIIDGVGTLTLSSLPGWVAGSWNLIEYAITGLSSINIRRSGATEVQIDEVRFHPVSARMATSTYHPFYGITSQTDANNLTVYTEHDEFGRTKNVLDDKRNIVKTYLYNFQK